MAEYAVMPKADYVDACDAIREKSGSADLIKSGEMGAAIREIQTGGGSEPGKPYIDTSKITDFSYFNHNNSRRYVIDNIDTSNGAIFTAMFNRCDTLRTIKQLDTSKGTNFSSMFNQCSKVTTIPQLDTGNGTNFSNMFYYCTSLETIPLINTSNGLDFSAMFSDCQKLKSVPQLDMEKATNVSSMFKNCYELQSIPKINTKNSTNCQSIFYGCKVLETIEITTAKTNLSTNTFGNCTALKNITIGEGWNVNIYLNYSNELTVESLHGMIENLADLTGTTAKTFQVGATNLAKIDEEHMQMLTTKNWNYS